MYGGLEFVTWQRDIGALCVLSVIAGTRWQEMLIVLQNIDDVLVAQRRLNPQQIRYQAGNMWSSRRGSRACDILRGRGSSRRLDGHSRRKDGDTLSVVCTCIQLTILIKRAYTDTVRTLSWHIIAAIELRIPCRAHRNAASIDNAFHDKVPFLSGWVVGGSDWSTKAEIDDPASSRGNHIDFGGLDAVQHFTVCTGGAHAHFVVIDGEIPRDAVVIATSDTSNVCSMIMRRREWRGCGGGTASSHSQLVNVHQILVVVVLEYLVR
mmetsp:Transcript_59560/g.94773  ORF Transcript_59560/g.94773 Transcript_59560/m.94773 type:complete len:265 (+) Transcript_59560:808-1602(+)